MHITITNGTNQKILKTSWKAWCNKLKEMPQQTERVATSWEGPIEIEVVTRSKLTDGNSQFEKQNEYARFSSVFEYIKLIANC